MLLLGIALSSCINPFRPNLYDVSDADILNRNPIELLQNLERAYTEKNINIYRSLLHQDFRFELIASEVSQIGIDVNGDGLRDSWWGYEQEVEITNRMFNFGSSDGSYPSPDAINLRLQIPPQEVWENDPELGHEDWIVIPCSFDLLLSYTATNSSFNANGVARFYLRPVADRWYIAIWRDESNL
jgi:hypothetical protein